MADVNVVITPTPDVAVEVTEEGSPPVSVTLTPPPEVVEVQVPGPAGPPGEPGPQGEPGEGGGASTWDELTGKPSTFPPSAHEHDHITTLPTDSITLADPITAYPYGFSLMYTVAVLTENTFAYGDPSTRLPGNGSQGMVMTVRVFDEVAEGDFLLQWYTGTAETMTHARQYYPGSGWEPWLKGPYWGDIVAKPSTFPPSAHEHDHIINLTNDSLDVNSALSAYPYGLSEMYSDDQATDDTFAWWDSTPAIVRTMRMRNTADTEDAGYQEIFQSEIELATGKMGQRARRVWLAGTSEWSNFVYGSHWLELEGQPSTFPPSAHASSHTNGTDDIQSATASQKGLMTSAYASKLDGIESGATADQTTAEIRGAIKLVEDAFDGSAGISSFDVGVSYLPISTSSTGWPIAATTFHVLILKQDGASGKQAAVQRTAARHWERHWTGSAWSSWVESTDVANLTGYSALATDAEVTSAISAHEALSDPHPGYLTPAEANALYKAIGYVPDWTDITGKPSTFAPSTHASSHVTGGSDVIANSVAGGNAGLMSGTDKTKLDGIETGATADQTAAEILTAVKTVDGAGSGLDADLLDGHDTGFFATASHAAQHKGDGSDPIANATASVAGLESAADKTKLDGIETAATADQTAAEILTAVKTVDGSGSGLDADLLDGNNSSAFAAASHATSHVTGGSDVIANAVASGNAGLLSGTDKSKLDGIESGATQDQTASEILTAIKTVDGTGSGLDADLLDGHDTAYFATATSVSDHLADTVDAHDAAAISYAGTTGTTADDLEEAVDELFANKANGLMNVVEVDLGSTPCRSGHFDITTTGLTAGQNIIIEQVVGPYTGKGTLADEAEMDQLTVTGQAISTTVIRCYWTSPTVVRGNIKFAYTLVSTLNTVPEATTSTSGLLKSAFQETHIEGLNMVWSSPGTNGTNLTVTSGSAWIPSLSAVMNVPSNLTGPSMTFSASTWYYVYLTSSGTLEISTTAPAAPYKGTARTKTGDTSRRFVGAVLAGTGGTPAMTQFLHLGDEMIYNGASPGGIYRVINGAGPGVSNTTQSLAAICPPGITTDVAGALTAATGATAGVAIIEYMLLSSQRWGIAGGIMGVSGFLFTTSWFPVNPATPSFIYSTTGPASSTFYFDVGGYKFVR